MTQFHRAFHFTKPRQIWVELEDRFGYSSLTLVYSLEQQLADLHQGSKSISDFFTEIKALWDAVNDVSPLQYCYCNKCTYNVNQRIHLAQQDHRLLQFMMKLNERYANVRGNDLMQQTVPPISSVFRMFSQEEKHQELSQLTSKTDSLAFAAASSQKNYKACVKTATASGSKKGSPYFCTHCKMSGHTMDMCFKLHGYPANFKGSKDKRVAAYIHQQDPQDNSTTPISSAQYQQLMELLNWRT